MERSHRGPRRSSHGLQKTTASDNNPSKHGSTTSDDVRDWRSRRTSKRSNDKPVQVESGDVQGDFSDNPCLIGTCPHMCPEEERLLRERLRDLAVFERLHGNPATTSSGLAVKKFCRTISSKQLKPSDVRPLSVLEDTLNYLINLLNSSEHRFEVIHDFIFDRMRSVRQDLSMQNIVDAKAVRLYEEMVKFHVTSHHQLRSCSSNQDISSVHHLNMEQLKKTLSALFSLYKANQNSSLAHKNEAEFHSLYVLLHLDFKSHAMGESLSLWFRHLPAPIIKSREMWFARSILRYFRMGNYKRFISIVATEASYLQFCVIEPYMHEIRVLAVSCINKVSYKLHPYPLGYLAKLLMMEESDLECLCNSCGLEICTDDEGHKSLPTRQTSFCESNKDFRCYGFLGLDKLQRISNQHGHRGG